jgi:PAS domain-containing protein
VAAAQNPGGGQFEATHRRRDGTSFPVEVSTRSLEINGQRFRQSIVRDITARRSAEAALLERMDELRRWSIAASDREERVITLKQEVNELLVAHGRSPRYASGEQDGNDHG